MTANDAITALDALKPNSCTAATKLQWLTAVSAQLQTEVWLIPASSAQTYTAVTDTLIEIPPAYRDIWVQYLSARVDETTGDMASYAHSAALFNATLSAYTRWFIRERGGAERDGAPPPLRHASLVGCGEADLHPVSAVSGLRGELDTLTSRCVALNNRIIVKQDAIRDLDELRAGAECGLTALRPGAAFGLRFSENAVLPAEHRLGVYAGVGFTEPLKSLQPLVPSGHLMFIYNEGPYRFTLLNDAGESALSLDPGELALVIGAPGGARKLITA